MNRAAPREAGLLLPAVTSRRDGALDALRGLCIISMIIGHMAQGSLMWKVTHFGTVDAASGFMLMSGLVLGMVQRRVFARSGARFAAVKIVRRVVVIYVAHLSIVTTAVLMAAWRPGSHRALPDLARYNSAAEIAWHIVTLRLNPTYLDILPLYLIFMVLAVLATTALQRGHWQIVLALSIAAYCISQVTQGWAVLPRQEGVPGDFNWMAWQVLFFAALTVGWHWASLRERLHTRAVITAASVVALAAGVAAAALRAVATSSTNAAALTEIALDKGSLGLVRLILALAALLLLYRASTWLVGRSNVLSPLARLGRHSLDSFVILSLAVAIVPTVLGNGAGTMLAQTAALAVALLCWAWAVLRSRVAKPPHLVAAPA